MEALLFVAVVGGAALASGAFWVYRRRRELADGPGWDEPWSEPEQSPEPDEEDLPRVVLDRDALLHRPRTFDPDAWDDSPDEGPADRPGDWAPDADPDQPTPDRPPASEPAPLVDRDFLESLRRRREAALDEEWPV